VTIAALVVLNIVLLYLGFVRQADDDDSGTMAPQAGALRTEQVTPTAGTATPRRTPTKTTSPAAPRPSVKPSPRANIHPSPFPVTLPSLPTTQPSPLRSLGPSPFPSIPPPSPPTIELTTTTLSGEPFRTVRLQGTYAPLNEPTTLRVQRRQRGQWVSFPLPVVTDGSGNFTAHVDVGRTGRYRLRIMDPETDTTSDVAVLYVRPSPPSFPSTPPPPSPPTIELTRTTLSSEPFQTVRLQGTYAPLDEPTALRVERRQRGQWVSFPLPVVTDRSGNFTAHVDLGRTGRYRLRIMDPETGTTSEVAVLHIR
jgi:hypothetical protein